MRAVLAHFAAAIKAPLRPIKSKDELELGRFGRPSVANSSRCSPAEKNRRGSAATDTVRKESKEHIDWLQDRIAELDEQLQALLKSRPSGKSKMTSSKCPRHWTGGLFFSCSLILPEFGHA